MATTTNRPATKTTTPAAKPESAAAKASRTAPLDLAFLSSVTVEKADRPERAAGAGRKAADNSLFENWIRQSWDERKDGEKLGVGYGMVIPADQVGVFKSRLNKAAATLNLGVSIAEDEMSGGKVRVRYCAKVRKQAKKTADEK